MHEKATLRKDLESWRGRKFTQAEIENFPGLKTVLGKPCMLNVVHSDDGKHANIGAVLPLPAGMTAPPAVGKQVYLSLDEDFDPDLFNALSDNLKKTISASPEYQQLMTGGRNPAPSTGSDPQDDDIPF